MKRLFLTGTSGFGKSTCIWKALGDHMYEAGGFLSVRHTNEVGEAMYFTLQRPDGSDAQIFLDYSGPTRKAHLDVFEDLGVKLLEESLDKPFIVLDEIGGIELLCPKFVEALEKVLRSGIPCIGVMKPEGPATKLICKLGLDQRFEEEAAKLRRWMREDPDTVVYECSQYDPKGLELCRTFTEKYCR